MKFTVGGRMINLERQDMISLLQGKTPPVHGRHKHFVLIGRKVWPVKSAVCEATGLDPLTFPTSEAVRVLNRLGFATSREG